MKKIYFLPGYQTTGKKFECIQSFYKDSKEYLPINWDWNEYMDIPKFYEEKIKILKEDTDKKILMADSMGGNLSWNILNYFPNLQYVMTNPVFDPDQIIEQERILPEMRRKIFTANKDNIVNKNLRLIISKYDEVLYPDYYQKIFTPAFPVLFVEDTHSMPNMKNYMSKIHELIEHAFKYS